MSMTLSRNIEKMMFSPTLDKLESRTITLRESPVSIYLVHRYNVHGPPTLEGSESGRRYHSLQRTRNVSYQSGSSI